MSHRVIVEELKRHAPFTALGTASGLLVMALLILVRVPRSGVEFLFWGFHPLHVFLSALVTAALYRQHSSGGVWKTLAVGYVGSVGIATLSDSVIPFFGEWFLQLPHRAIHIGCIEKWWLVNPLALLGTGTGFLWSRTRVAHAGHVLISTWASLFHMMMAVGTPLDLRIIPGLAVFLFISVWIPCCTSDIVFPLLWVKK